MTTLIHHSVSRVEHIEEILMGKYDSIRTIKLPKALCLDDFQLSPIDTKHLEKLSTALKEKTYNVRVYALSLSWLTVSPAIIDFMVNLVENMPERHFLKFHLTKLEAGEIEQVEKGFLKLRKVRQIKIYKSDSILGPVLEYATRINCSFLEFEFCNFTQHTKLFRKLLYRPNLVELSLKESLLKDISSSLLVRSTRFFNSLKKLVFEYKSIPEVRLVALLRGLQEVTKITSLRLQIILDYRVCYKLLSDLVTRNPDFLFSLRLENARSSPEFNIFVANMLAWSNLVDGRFPRHNFCSNDSYSTLRLSLEEFARVKKGRKVELLRTGLTVSQIAEVMTLAKERGFSFQCRN